MADRGTWSPQLKCYVSRILVECAQHRATILVPDGSCTDMGGAIDLISSIDPEVNQILTMHGDNLDFIYCKKNGHWEAFDYRERSIWEQLSNLSDMSLARH